MVMKPSYDETVRFAGVRAIATVSVPRLRARSRQ